MDNDAVVDDEHPLYLQSYLPSSQLDFFCLLKQEQFLWEWQRSLDWGLKHWGWWRLPPPPPLAAIRIPTRQIYGHPPQVGPSPINRYFTPAICFVANAINLVGEAGKRRYSQRVRSNKSPQHWARGGPPAPARPMSLSTYDGL